MRAIVVLGLPLFLVLSVAGLGLSVEPGEHKNFSFMGTWLRVEKYANNTSLRVDETATLVLTKNTFSSDSKGVPGAECSNSGSLTVRGDIMTMAVKASTCPSIINVGSVVKHTYSVSPDNKRLTFINKEWGYTYKEVLQRK